MTKINLTDVVFGLSFLAYEGTLFTMLAKNAVSAEVLTWVAIVTGLIAGAAYFLYEKVQGVPVPPQQPQPPVPPAPQA